MSFMLRNSDGEKDGTWTLLVFIVTLLMAKFMISGITLYVNGKQWDMGATDAAFAIAMVGPAYAAYTSRRNNDKKADAEVTKSKVAAAASVSVARAQSGNYPSVSSSGSTS